MDMYLAVQMIALGFYVLFMFFTFCDGFKLPVVKKLIWALAFLAVCFLSVTGRGFDLAAIIASGSLTAFIICWFDMKFKRKAA